MTGHLLALDAPVAASQATAPGPFTDGNGFFKQGADVAAQRGVQVVYQGTGAPMKAVTMPLSSSPGHTTARPTTSAVRSGAGASTAE